MFCVKPELSLGTCLGRPWLLGGEERTGHSGPDALLRAFHGPSRLTDQVLNPHREGSEDRGRFPEELYVVLRPGDQEPWELGKGHEFVS